MEIVIQYVKRQLSELEEVQNDNREIQREQLQRYLNKLKKVLTIEQYDELMASLTDSQKGKDKILYMIHKDLRARQVQIKLTYDKYYNDYKYSIQLVDKATLKLSSAITRRLVRGI